MEMHTRDGRRTVLVALDEHGEGSMLMSSLYDVYNVVVARGTQGCLDAMRENCASLSAVIIDIEVAREGDWEVLDEASSETLIDTIPVIISTRRPLQPQDMECLSHGASDIIAPPFYAQLAIHRIETAIRSKSAKTFYEIEKILGRLPSNIFMKDAHGRYLFSTKILGHLDTGGDPNWSIYGKTDFDVRKDKANALKAMEADAQIIKSGKGTSYVIEENTTGRQEFLELIKEPVFDDDGNVEGIIAIVNDVTEAELLRRQLAHIARTDELTGLGNHRAFGEAIEAINEAGTYPVAVISADCDGLKAVNDNLGHLIGDEYIRMAATAFIASLPDTASAFRTGGDEFIAFVPGADSQVAEKIISEMRRQNGLLKVQDRQVSVSYGFSVVESADDTVLEAVRAADKGMYDNKAARMRSRVNCYINKKE